MYECVMGLRKHEGQGCILADEMYDSYAHCAYSFLTALVDQRGLGKTLQVSAAILSE
jgi:hypothetical protein